MMAIPTALLLRPLSSSDHQPSIASVSTTSLVGSSSSHGSFSLFVHHRRTKSFRPTIARITPVEENLEEEEQAPPSPIIRSVKNPPPWEQGSAPAAVSDNKNSPPWLEVPANAFSVDASRSKTHNYRPAPWQQGSTSSRSAQQGRPDQDMHVEGTLKHLDEEEGEQSAMAKIVDKLRHIQKGYVPAENDKDAKDGREDSFKLGKGAWRGTRAAAHNEQNSAFDFGKRTQSQHGRVDGEGKIAAASSSANFNSRVMANSVVKNQHSKIQVKDAESEAPVPKFPWEKDEKDELEEKLTRSQKRGPRIPTLAELTLPRDELIRLRLRGLQLEERLRIGKLGVTKSIVISIQEQFRSSELVKVRCEGPAAAFIKKTHLELEEKTGGLVVLRTGKIIVVYRGSGYKAEQRSKSKVAERKAEGLSSGEKIANVQQTDIPLPDGVTHEELVEDTLSVREDTQVLTGSDRDMVDKTISHPGTSSELDKSSEAEAEAESILEGLGPRYENWAGLLPVPIDGDLLPQVIPNYRPPFRLMPYGVKPRISDTELTTLRRLARPLAPHFVLGRNRGHQGLAAAIVKLWEKSEVAKIAVKRRVQNTNNLIMSDELKRLTGGILLSRDKFFITFYRGKDFIPEKVASALMQREASVRDLQELEEKAREERNIPVKWTPYTKPSVAVIGDAAPAAKPSWTHTMDVKEQERLKREVAKLQRLTLTSQLQKKLEIANKKKRKAEEELKKVDVFLNPIDRPVDVETITEEERFMFRKLGLKMKAYLLIGRRGVFDGVVENMHLHWKHRELVKVVVKEVDIMEVQDIARTLEYESGGVLVAVAPTRKGQAIIMYRGKNYQRPIELRPRNLLTKRKALKRSLEMQRHEDLSRNIRSIEDQISSIQAELRKIGDVDGQGSSEGLVNHHQNQLASATESKGGVGNEAELTKFKETSTQDAKMDQAQKIKQLERLVRSGPLFRADPLSNPEKLRLRKLALNSGKPPQFFVGQNNGLEGVARGIRVFFLHHSLAKIVVKGRSPGVSIEAIIRELEELTGGVVVSQEANKIIMYRGWPSGWEIPFAGSLGKITPELLGALEAEEDWEDEASRDYPLSRETEDSDQSELDDDDDNDGGAWLPASLLANDDTSEYESEQMAIWEDINEGSDGDSAWDDEDDDEDEDAERESEASLASSNGDIGWRSDLKFKSNVDAEEDNGLDLQGHIYDNVVDAADDEDKDDDDDDFEQDGNKEEGSDEKSSWDVEADWVGSEDEDDSDISSSFGTMDEHYDDESDPALSGEPTEAW